MRLEIIEDDNLTLPERLAKSIDKHYEDNPRHGAGCACLDEAIRQLRIFLDPLKADYNDFGSKESWEREAERGKSHVLHIASMRRY